MNACIEAKIHSGRSASWQGRTEVARVERRLRVWLVDDDQAVSKLLADLLDRVGGMECDQCFGSAESARRALAQEDPPDVILLDVKLGRENGIDAIRPIKSLAPTTQVLMLTTFYDSDNEARAMRAGASDFLVKSDPVEKIVERIRQPQPSARFATAVLR